MSSGPRRLVALLGFFILLAAPSGAAARRLDDRPSGFSVSAPADFALRVDRAHHIYRIRSRMRAVEITLRLARTRSAPAQLVAHAGGRSRALAKRVGGHRVALARFHGRGLDRRGNLSTLRQIARSASVRSPVPPGAPSSTPAPGSSSGSSPGRSWDANFDAARSPCGFDDVGWEPYTPSADFPDCPTSVGIASAASEGVPKPPSGQRNLGHFEVTAADAQTAQPRFHAKLFKAFFAPGYGEASRDEHQTRPPADVSGTYSAWYYLPSGFTIPGSGWRNIFQFKERYWDGTHSGYQSDPLYWLALYNGDGDGTPYATVNYWNGGNARGVGRHVVFPRDRWVQVKAVIRQGRSIEFSVDGQLMATGQNSTYPVAPFHGKDSLGWDFGVGNYSGAGVSGRWQDRVSGAPLLIGGASYRG